MSRVHYSTLLYSFPTLAKADVQHRIESIIARCKVQCWTAGCRPRSCWFVPRGALTLSCYCITDGDVLAGKRDAIR